MFLLFIEDWDASVLKLKSYFSIYLVKSKHIILWTLEDVISLFSKVIYFINCKTQKGNAGLVFFIIYKVKIGIR